MRRLLTGCPEGLNSRLESRRETVRPRPTPRHLQNIPSSRWELCVSGCRSTTGRRRMRRRDALTPLRLARWFHRSPAAPADGLKPHYESETASAPSRPTPPSAEAPSLRRLRSLDKAFCGR